MGIGNIFELDFNKPIYTKLTDGIHQVKFERAELIIIDADIRRLGAKIKARIAGIDGYVSSTSSLYVTNDLDALVRCDGETKLFELTFMFYGKSLLIDGNIHRITTATHIKEAFTRNLLRDYATFSFTIKNDKICRWVWEGTRPILIPYMNLSIEDAGGVYGLQFDLLTKQFIEPKGKRKIGNEWVEPKYYDTEEQCRKENGVKVFTFED